MTHEDIPQLRPDEELHLDLSLNPDLGPGEEEIVVQDIRTCLQHLYRRKRLRGNDVPPAPTTPPGN